MVSSPSALSPPPPSRAVFSGAAGAVMSPRRAPPPQSPRPADPRSCGLVPRPPQTSRVMSRGLCTTARVPLTPGHTLWGPAGGGGGRIPQRLPCVGPPSAPPGSGPCLDTANGEGPCALRRADPTRGSGTGTVPGAALAQRPEGKGEGVCGGGGGGGGGTSTTLPLVPPGPWESEGPRAPPPPEGAASGTGRGAHGRRPLQTPPPPSRAPPPQINEMCGVFLGQWGQRLWEAALVLEVMACLWLYCALMGTTLLEALPLPGLAGPAAGCARDAPLAPGRCHAAYCLWLLLIAAVLVPVTLHDLKQLGPLHVGLTAVGYGGILLLLGSVAYALACAPAPAAPPGARPPGGGWAVPAGLGALFGATVFAQMCHIAVPSLTQVCPPAREGAAGRQPPPPPPAPVMYQNGRAPQEEGGLPPPPSSPSKCLRLTANKISFGACGAKRIEGSKMFGPPFSGDHRGTLGGRGGSQPNPPSWAVHMSDSWAELAAWPVTPGWPSRQDRTSNPLQTPSPPPAFEYIAARPLVGAGGTGTAARHSPRPLPLATCVSAPHAPVRFPRGRRSGVQGRGSHQTDGSCSRRRLLGIWTSAQFSKHGEAMWGCVCGGGG